MFVYSIKGQNLKLILSLMASAMVIVFIVALFPARGGVGALNENDLPAGIELKESDCKNIETNEDRVLFLKKIGWTVEPEITEVREVTIPEIFDSVYNEYNQLQLECGMDLEKYKGKSVKKYTYLVHNYDYDGSVLATLLIYKGKVIGGDISSAKTDGFKHSILAGAPQAA